MHTAHTHQPLWQKYLLIAGLYLAQGLPGGLIAYTLPVLMREQGVAQKWISLFSLVGIPWSIKLLWSRHLDQSAQKPRYILLSFVLTALCWVVLSVQPIDTLLASSASMVWVIVLLLFANFVMASQDILTDGMTVRLLNDQERGLANSLQVLAYKMGMLLSGGMFLSYYSQVGWATGMRLIVLILTLGYLPCLYQLWVQRSAPLLQALQAPATADTSASARSKPHSTKLLSIIKGFVQTRGVAYWLLLLVAYKLPDGLISTVVRPFAVDYGMSRAAIGQVTNYAIILGGISGVVAGFLWRSQRMHYQWLLMVLALMQIISSVGYFSLNVLPHSTTLWWCVSLFEPIVDTMSTVVLFATMMHFARREFAGVDYTFQATLFVVAASSMHLVGGWLTDAAGHAVVFGVAIALSLLTVVLTLRPLELRE